MTSGCVRSRLASASPHHGLKRLLTVLLENLTIPPKLRQTCPTSPRRNHMQLLTAELRSKLPPLYSQEKNKDPTVHLKIFCPWSNWTWFATEGAEDEGEFLFFGY